MSRKNIGEDYGIRDNFQVRNAACCFRRLHHVYRELTGQTQAGQTQVGQTQAPAPPQEPQTVPQLQPPPLPSAIGSSNSSHRGNAAFGFGL